MNRQERRAAAKQSPKVAPQNLEAAKRSLEAAKQGKLLFDLGRYAEALECFNIFAKLNPNVPALHQTRGLCLQRLGRFEEAQADFERSIALNPGEAETHKNLGTLHSRFGRMEQALASIDRALALRPNFSAALNEKARALWSLQLLDEAFAAFHKSLAVDPSNAHTIWNLALLQMLTGDFERGLSGREARWKASLGLVDRGFSCPLWLRDQPIEGKTILLHADEGLGDTIQFARYVPLVAALGARVILEVQSPIQQLLGDITGVATCIDRSSSTSPAFDLHCPLGSLPLAFGTRLDTIPFAQAYLPAPPAARVKAWEDLLEDRLGLRNRFRVGLAWSGNPDHNNDHNRSMALRSLAPLLDCDVQFVSLQKGVRDQDRAFLAERFDILDLTDQLTDFSDTAALISCLDLVISVDTSVVHLAGALGTPVWTMLPFNPDWRWLLNRDDSPWYSSMRLFRQPKRGDWASVVDCVRLELEGLVSAWRSGARQHQSKALPPTPQEALLSNYLGYQHWQLGRMDEAALHFQQALKLYPQYLDAAINCGRLLLDLGRHTEAQECFNAAEKLNPNSAALYQIRGMCHQEANRLEEAEADYNKSIALDPGLAETHSNLGTLHSKLGRMEQALASLDRALELRPDFSAALSNKAWILLDLQLLDEAFATFHRSLAIEPNRAPTIFNFALLQLLTGDFERGWRGREARPSLGTITRGFSSPPWLGDQPIEGKSILLYCDEGLGDSIQFARYVPLVAALGARVILAVQPPIQKLLSGTTGVATCVGDVSGTSLAFDLHCALGSLPLAFRTQLDTIPFAQAYLPAPPTERVKAWEDRLGPRNRFRVGLVWSGNPDHKNDSNRSMTLRTLAPLLDCDVQFVSLQKGIRDQDRAFLRERSDIVDLTEQLTDFSETAALVCCLDLVISVDTSVVHLAGALGVPVWTMLPFSPDWRWLLNRDDSPWYRSMKLFRQLKRGDWASVVDCVRLELESLVSSWRPEARQHQSKALSPTPQDALLSNSLGNLLQQLKRTEVAELHVQRARELDPQSLETANRNGEQLFNLGRYAEALECFNVAERLNPNSAVLYQMRGVCLQEANQFEEAEADYEKSIALDPGLAETHNNLGLLHSRLGRVEQALARFDRALELRPDFTAVLNNKALALLNLQLLNEAFAIFHRSLAVDPNHAPTIFNLATLQLLTGDFERGWPGREARWKLPVGLLDRGFSQPLWLGDQPIEGKTILLHSDEGLGDAIQFARYVPMVAAFGARVILEVQPPIQRLLAGVSGVATCIGRPSATSLAFDLHCPLGTLPRVFGTRLDTIPFAQAYLPAPPAARVKAWEDLLGPRNRFRVGLVWSGTPDHKNDHNRSMALRTLAPLLDCDVQFVSLQKGVRDQDRAFLRERSDIVNLTDRLTDFSETAALVCCLDLVISVDTSVVHLAGALGVPVWTILPFSPDWRWLLNRDDSPWYRSMRLFRQPNRGDWASVVDCVRLDLEGLVSAWRPGQAPPLLLPAELESN
ncbi:tetratricopeptide repeat protein [Bradyrhizobium neotropicale]|uniref:tetratricopeptide repeat protein n=1 Tax=Bradyrhizobium neotropicale TaxID=1497615 RepID=UPI0009EEAF65|nr:tetratricopeptide repeat protein [Bradyrhizobium neotropicale]